MIVGAKVAVFPAWRSNPYLNMMSLAARSTGWRFIESTEFSDFMTTLIGLRSGDVAHIHWTSQIAQAAGTAPAAALRVARLGRALRLARARGVKVVWTVHNHVPHELRHHDQEAALYRLLAEAADAVHVMTADTPAMLAEDCTIEPSKVRLIPHPSYRGIYDTGISREAARESFDLSPDDVAVLFLGQIRPYKGVNTLMRAVDHAQRTDGRPLTLLLGGYATPDAVADLRAALPRHVRTVQHLDFVPDADIARWFGAADMAVFPYRRILNSGSVHLAATFAVPAILPDEPHLRRQYGDQDWVAFFDPADAEHSLARVIGDADQFKGVGSESFAGFTDPIGPWTVSSSYRDLLQELTGGRR